MWSAPPPDSTDVRAFRAALLVAGTGRSANSPVPDLLREFSLSTKYNTGGECVATATEVPIAWSKEKTDK